MLQVDGLKAQQSKLQPVKVYQRRVVVIDYVDHYTSNSRGRTTPKGSAMPCNLGLAVTGRGARAAPQKEGRARPAELDGGLK